MIATYKKKRANSRVNQLRTILYGSMDRTPRTHQTINHALITRPRFIHFVIKETDVRSYRTDLFNRSSMVVNPSATLNNIKHYLMSFLFNVGLFCFLCQSQTNTLFVDRLNCPCEPSRF